MHWHFNIIFGAARTLSGSKQFSENLKSLSKVSGGAERWTKVIWCVSLCSSSPVPDKIQDSQLSWNFIISTNKFFHYKYVPNISGTYLYWKYLLFENLIYLGILYYHYYYLLNLATLLVPSSPLSFSRYSHCPGHSPCTASFSLLTLSYCVQATVTKYYILVACKHVYFS